MTIRLGEKRLNNQGCLMKVIKYIEYKDILVQFQDEYNGIVHTTYKHFIDGSVKNPYYPSVYNIGMIGVKYPSKINKKQTKEYEAWKGMLRRCYDKKKKEEQPSYKDVSCCDEWLLYENFYEWLHEQDNFDKWLNNDGWAIDKDILIKGNKIYSPDTCCLVPQNVNNLFTKRNNYRGNLPIGVVKRGKKFQTYCRNPFYNTQEFLGTYDNLTLAFQTYKEAKELYIKQLAKEEYDKGNITKQCYNAMMNYKVEITD
jgi:hypothetical protein